MEFMANVPGARSNGHGNLMFFQGQSKRDRRPLRSGLPGIMNLIPDSSGNNLYKLND